MGKKITIVGIFLLAILAIGMKSQAAKTPSVTFTKGEQLILSDTSLGNVFEGMAAGDERTLAIEVKNENKNTTDFYMSAEALQSLEDVNKASGGAYGITLMVNESVIYSNNSIGGALSTGTTTSKGLYDVIELKNKLFVATLKTGEKAVVKFTMGLDGEAITNNENNSYSNAVGQFNFEFQAAYDGDKGLTVVNKEVVTIVPNKVPFANGPVATGDNTNVWPFVLALVVGVLLVVATIIILIKKKRVSALGLVLVLCLVPVGKMHATELATVDKASDRQYTVSFRSGASGKFEDGNSEHKFLVAADGSAKIEDYMLDEVTPKDGYYIKGGSWATSVGTPITKSSEYILTYGKLSSNAVSYRIEYVDAESGNQIANSVIRYANPGDTIKTPGVKFIENYAFTAASPVEGIKLSNTQNNVIQLSYKYTAGRTIENIVNRVVEGETTIITVNPAAPVTPVVTPPQEPATPEVNIEDEDTPQAETPTDENTNDSEDQEKVIEDEKTPKGSVPGQSEKEQKGNSIIILASVLAAIAVFFVAAYIVVAKKKKQSNVHEEDKN